MSEEMEPGLLLEKMNQLGHLDRLFTLAEERVNRDPNGIDCLIVAGYPGVSEDSCYEVYNPLTDTVAYRVPQRLFHGFLRMRYREIGHASEVIDRRSVPLTEMLDLCAAAIEGRPDFDLTNLNVRYFVMRRDGLYRAISLIGTYDYKTDGDIRIDWAIQSLPPGGMEVN